ncbi:hypothetical protein EDC01DRAFT_731326 [Geopyxis carbonaria]|nr:hypothetical protein EDC01DRAFT_731326 [Geopyxis carbonaria]
MSGKYLLPVLVAVTGSFMVLVPHLQSALRLFHLGRDFTADDARIHSLISHQCTLEHPSILTGCEDMTLIGNAIYTACTTSAANTHKWGRHPNATISHIPGDAIYRWDLASNAVTALSLRNLPGPDSAAGRSFLGLDINERPDGTLSLYIVNLLPEGNVIDKFAHDPATDYMTHVLRVPTTAEGAAPLPNAIFALPEHDDDAAMWVTNDHRHGHGPWRAVEMYTRRPWSWISFYSVSTGWKTVLPGLVGVNGITGDKDPANRKLYASELVAGAVRVLKPSETTFGDVEQVQTIDIGMTGDNPSLWGDDLYIAGTARGHLFEGWKNAAEGEKPWGLFEGGPGMVVKRVNTRQLGQGFYGKGYTAPPVVEEVVMDAFGRMVNVSSSVIFRPYDVEVPVEAEAEGEAEKKGSDDDDEEEEELEVPGGKVKVKGDLFITGIASKGIWKCKDFE